MLGHYAISSAPLSGLAVSVTLKLGASSVSANATTAFIARKTVFTASANSAHLTTNQIPRRLREGISANSASVSTVTLAHRKGVSSVLSQGSATNTVQTQKVNVTSSANSASATTIQTSKRLREATSQNSSNVVSNIIGARTGISSVGVSSLASSITDAFRIAQLQFGLSSSVNLDTIGDILWEKLISELGVATNIAHTELSNSTNITFTELTPATSSVSWNDLGNP